MIYHDSPSIFKWPDLHGKILRIYVAEPNSEVMEPLGQVFGLDLENGATYLLAEFNINGDLVTR